MEIRRLKGSRDLLTLSRLRVDFWLLLLLGEFHVGRHWDGKLDLASRPSSFRSPRFTDLKASGSRMCKTTKIGPET